VKNTLFYGDNLDVMRRYIADESIDLVYLDPPFNSNADYNVLFREHGGAKAAAQIRAFEDTWEWNLDAARAYEETVESGGRVSETLQAFWKMLGDSDMMAYLAMMAPRLKELHRVLKPTGSLYLHCDPTASSYLRIILDALFDPRNFRNEIVWKRTGSHGDARRKFSSTSDNIFFYTKGNNYTFNKQFVEHSEDYIKSKYRFFDADGRRYRLSDLRSPNPRPNLTYDYKGYKPHPNGWAVSLEKMQELDAAGRLQFPKRPDGRIEYKRFLDELKGQPISNVWEDIPPINSRAQERLHYPTQKPEALLRRILTTSANPGDTFLDPFCGCGTAISVAEQVGLAWIGIDVTHLAIGLIKHRLQDQFGPAIATTYRVIGEPVSLPDAERLAGDDPFQFQAWALGLVGARTAQSAQKGADKGIDGNLYFHDDPKGHTKRVILSVKAGANVSVAMIRDLAGTIGREKAEVGVLITMTPPTTPMTKEAASAGFYTSPMGGKHPRLQILTVEDLLAGKGIDYPARSQRADLTFRKARRIASNIQALPLSAFIAPGATLDPEDGEEAE